jgi:hypothetical protein
MLVASVVSDVLLWLLIGGYVAHHILIRMFGAEWLKQLGDYIRLRVGFTKFRARSVATYTDS